jgi:GNAT superfamily N-acetyltransferase
MVEMDAFYGVTSKPDPLGERVAQIDEVLFSEHPSAHALLAFDGPTLVGIASYSFLWPAVGLTSSLYLKELYIIEARRGIGIGKSLMKSLFGVALKQNCSRVEWTTDSDNSGAQSFYENLRVPRNSSKIFYRLEGEALRRAID